MATTLKPRLARRLTLPLLLMALGVVADVQAQGAGAAQAAPTSTPIAIVKRYTGSRPLGNASAGSATLVAKTASKAYWLTAFHVTKSGHGYLTISRPGKETLQAKQLDYRVRTDLALVRTSSHTVTENPVAIWTGSGNGRIWYGEGYAGASYYPVGQGTRGFGRRKGQFTRLWDNGSRAEFSMPSIPGESGGCIYTMHNGIKYQGSVVTSSNWPSNRTGSRNGYTFGASPAQVRSFLNANGLAVAADGYVRNAGAALAWAGRGWLDPSRNQGPIERIWNDQQGNGPLQRLICNPNGGGCYPEQQQPPNQLQGGPIPERFIAPIPQQPQVIPQSIPQQPVIQQAPPQIIQVPAPQPERVIRQRMQLDVQGVPGRDGIDGKDGANGRDGVDGRPGTPGRDADMSQVQQMISRALAGVRPRTDSEVEAIARRIQQSSPQGPTISDIRLEIADAVRNATAGITPGVTEGRVREIMSQNPSGVSRQEVESIAEGAVQRGVSGLQESIQQLAMGYGQLNDKVSKPTPVFLGDRPLGSFRLGEDFVIPPLETPRQQIIPMAGAATISNIVVVGKRNNEMERKVDEARQSFSRITLVPEHKVPPSVFVRRYPTLVAYSSNGTVTGLVDGPREVSERLEKIARGDYP